MIGIVLFFFGSWVLKKMLSKPAKPNTFKYWLKYLVAYFYAKKIKKSWPSAFSYSITATDLGELGVFNSPDAWRKDCPQKFSGEKNQTDAIEIWGGDKQGNLLFISFWRRPDRQAEVILYLKLINGNVYQLPSNPDTIVYHTDGQSFKAGGLSIEIHEPVRRCRVTFSGLLRKSIKYQWSDSEQNEDLVDVQFCFTWHPASMYYTFEDNHDFSAISDKLAQAQWEKETLKNPKFINLEGFENWGHWYGSVIVEGAKENRLLLRGSRHRKYGGFDWNNLQQSVVIKGYTQKGIGVHIDVTNTTENIKNVVDGYLSIPADMKQATISSIDWNIDALVSNKELPRNFSYNFIANKEKYLLGGTSHNKLGFRLNRGSNWSAETLISPISFHIGNKDDGFGFLIITRPYVGSCSIERPDLIPLIENPDFSKVEKIVTSFQDIECADGQLVGGKGASLAHLMKIKNDSQLAKFDVPNGFCVTKFGFEMMVKQSKVVQTAISNLENVAWQKIDGALQDVCQSCVDAVITTEIPVIVKENVNLQLKNLFDIKNLHDKTFAVRSSAIGEDGEELSSAGQNETFLGVTGLNNICDAIVKCWASQFAFRSVEYRRQNGQLINSGMSVVIQEMVAADSAGVLFSRDPRSGSNSTMIVSSNYGLGESVVSALSDPDTIILQRSPHDRLTIKDKQIGNKSSKIVISVDGGTIEALNSKEESNQCSLADDVIIQLGEIALYLEKRYGSARDLEWAITKDGLYILQSRPVTTGVAITEDELMHEFDCGLRSDYETFTNANLGEVMPGAHTPLMMTAGRRVHGMCFLSNPNFCPFSRYDPTNSNTTPYFYNNIFFDRVMQKRWNLEEKKSVMTKSMEIGFFGRVIDDDEKVVQMVNERFPPPTFFGKLMGMLFPFVGMIMGKKFLKSAEERYRHYPMHAEGAKTAQEAFDKICNKVMDVREILMGHIQIMMGSNFWNFVILKLIAGDSSEFTLDHYHDFSVLVGSGNGAESGDVPFSMMEIVNLITLSKTYTDFSTMDSEKALALINADSGSVGQKFREFINRHGHRGIREFELRVPSWGMNLKGFVEILQKMVKGANGQNLQNTKSISISESIKNIKTPLSYIKKKLLVYALKGCKSGVCFREQAKSMMIKVEDSLRKSFCLLAKYMVNEGILPDTDLIYFLTFEEIGQVLKTRSSSLLSRAQKRRRIYPKMDSIRFEEIFTGFPKHWDKEAEEITKSLHHTLELKAYPVCHGSIKGIARVITSLDDAHLIQKGDILITIATDIGWSPYFPMISGIVTELGGLISHGAVVAREYGLPCLVAATKATQLFQSGDYVHLDSTNGVLRKLKQ